MVESTLKNRLKLSLINNLLHYAFVCVWKPKAHKFSQGNQDAKQCERIDPNWARFSKISLKLLGIRKLGQLNIVLQNKFTVQRVNFFVRWFSRSVQTFPSLRLRWWFLAWTIIRFLSVISTNSLWTLEFPLFKLSSIPYDLTFSTERSWTNISIQEAVIFGNRGSINSISSRWN